MSKGLAGVKTLTAKQIADKWKLPLAVVAKKIAAGVKVEKEHTTSTRQANEIARDHLGERPDYYDKLHKMEKTKIVKEDMTNVAGVTPKVSTQNIRQMVQGGRTPPSGTPNLQTITTPGGLTGTFSGNDAASKYAMDKQRHFDLNKNDGNFITSNAPRKDITSAADDMEARRQSGTLGQKDPEIEKTVRNYRYGVTNSDVTPSSMNSDITSSSKATPTTPGSYKTTPEIQKATDAIMNRKPGNDTESQKTSNIQEESATGAVRGLGFVTGDPGVNPVTQYINTNAMAYVDENGNKLDYIKKQHTNLHNSNLGYKAFDPTQIGANKNFIKEAKLNELGDYVKDGMPGYEGTTAPIRAIRKRDVKEQSPANPSYKERPLYERGKVPADMSDATARGIYEVSAKKVGQVHLRYLEQNKFPPDYVRNAVKRKWLESDVGKTPEEKEKEQRKKEVKEDANRPDRDLEARTYTGATGTTHTVKEETKMDNKELINEALDCILEDNLPEMKDNLMKALQEKAIEKLEERKKEIAANYFAQ